MAITCPRPARISLTNAIVAGVLTGHARFHLLGVNLVITDETTLANCLAAEATWSGYSSQLAGSWTTATDASGPKASTTAFATWTPTAGSGTVDVFGWFITDAASANLWLVNLMPAPPVTIAKGAPYTPVFSFDLFSG